MMYTISVAIENPEERVFTVSVGTTVQHSYTYKVRVSPKTVDQFDLTDEELPEVIEQAFRFLLERESPDAILPSFELMSIAVYFPEFTPGRAT